VENPGSIDGIKRGQELKIPAEKPKPQVSAADLDKYMLHNVAKGETVFSICQKYQISEQQLNQLNPDVKNGLKEGMVLKIKEKTKSVSTGTAAVTNNTTISTNTVASVDTASINITRSQKSAYAVGVFLPFSFTDADLLNIDELIVNKQSFPAAQQLAIDFYEGLQRAADSLKSPDFSITFKIYDVGEKDSNIVSKYTREDNFKNLDLIVGPMYNSSFRIISAEAKKLQIPCVSPLTQQNKVLFENPLASKTTPSNNSLLSALAAFCVDSIVTQNPVLINSGYIRDQSSIKYFKQLFNEKSAALGRKDTLPEVKGINGAKSAYKPDKLNYYILLSENETAISDFVTHLNMFADKKENIRVIGLRKWLNYDNLDLEYFNRFGLIFATSYYIDYDNAWIQKLSSIYRDKYFTDAGDYYYYAADLGLYYFGLLKNQGPAFCTALNKFPKKSISVNYDFVRPNNQTGFENQAVQIIRYSDYKLKKVN
jgi:LysM repeat protein